MTSSYYYRNDIIEANDELGNDDVYQALRAKIAEDYEDDDDYETDEEREDAINDAVNNTINLFKVNVNSALYSLLRSFLDDEPVKHASYGFIVGKWMYFRTGCGYDTIERGLLDGTGDGSTRRRFEEFVDKKGI